VSDKADWFDVSRKGLAKLIERRGKIWLLHELIANAWDADDVTTVEVVLEPEEGRPLVTVLVRDDAPDGFALDVATPIPTPSGWSTMGQVQVGDLIYDDGGKIRHVIAKTDVMYDRPCYEVVFADGEVLVADANHLWTVTDDNDRARNRPARILTTAQLAERVGQGRQDRRHLSTGIQAVLETPSLALPVDPYLLGYWLGDGTKRTSVIAVAKRDAEHLRDRAERAGYKFRHNGSYSASLHGLLEDLRTLGVLDEKHIPQLYLRGGVQQRLELLQGLVDSDGCSSSVQHSRRAEFVNTNLKLIEGFEELVQSLGGRITRRLRGRAGKVYPGIKGGKPIVQRKDVYRVSFTVPYLAFALPRKAAQFYPATERQRRRMIKAVRPCASRPVVCITTDAPSGQFLCGRSMVATHNCDITHAWTLFAESNRKGQAQKRGRFAIGEKLVLALCEEASIISTKGAVLFDGRGRSSMRARRDRGTEFQGIARITRAELAEIREGLARMIPPPHVATFVDGKRLPTRDPIKTIEATLPTEIADEDGLIRRTARKCTVHVHETLPGETGTLYEMGVPITETGDRWSVDIQQKVPLSMERDNVTPAYLRAIRTLVVNALHDKLTEEDASTSLVNDALADERATPEAVSSAIDAKYGKKRAVFDPSDPEANMNLVSQGYTLIKGGQLTRSQWDNVRKHGAAQPAGQIAPTKKALFSPDGEDNWVPEEKWTPAIRAVVAYARAICRDLLGASTRVGVLSDIKVSWAACFGSSQGLVFNLGRLGHDFFEACERGPTDQLNQLIIHELGHDAAPNHLDESYHEALCALGAKLARLALTKPEMFRW
jgi:hypothetical protein